MAKILTDKCQFQCSIQPGQLFMPRANQPVAGEKTGKYLTSKSSLTPMARVPCPPLSVSGPVMCPLQPTNNWLRFNRGIKLNGGFALTNDSFQVCPVAGGQLKPMVNISLFSTTAAVGSVPTIAEITLPTVQQKDGKSSDKSAKNSDQAAKQSSDQSSSTSQSSKNPASNDANSKQPVKEQKAVQEVNQETLNKDEEDFEVDYCYCKYKTCPKKQECDYLKPRILNSEATVIISGEPKVKSKVNITINNKSMILRDKMEQASCAEMRQEKEYLALHENKNAESTAGKWGYAAHHIICGNEVLGAKKGGRHIFGELVRLAKFYKYDINNALNGIYLPSRFAKDGAQNAPAFTVMFEMGRQYHLGPHDHEYNLDDSAKKRIAEYFDKNGELARDLPALRQPELGASYEKAVIAELQTILIKVENRLKGRCPAKNYEAAKQNFHRDMNALSGKIRRYLLAFSPDPKKSYPFYVSQIAYEYAFKLPRATRVMTIEKKSEHLIAQLYRLERFAKDDLEVKAKQQQTCKVEDTLAGWREIIICAANTFFFLTGPDITLPFAKHEKFGPFLIKRGEAGEDLNSYVFITQTR